MSNVPHTDALPHAQEGYDAARVEEAFAAFGDRVRELETIAHELRAELRSLRAERVAAVPFEEEAWPAERAPGETGAPASWVASVPRPLSHRPGLPRLVLEAGFLLLVALLAGLADLAAAWIVLVMAVAWALVALTEWAAAARRARWRLDEIAPPLAVTAEAADSTGPWDMPVVQATAVERRSDVSESKTVVTKLPVEPEEDVAAADPAPEEAQARPRRLRFWRRRPADAGTPDPWEA